MELCGIFKSYFCVITECFFSLRIIIINKSLLGIFLGCPTFTHYTPFPLDVLDLLLIMIKW